MKTYEYRAEVTRTETFSVYPDALNSEIRFQAGKADRAAGLPCLSANGAYLNGWYSDAETRFYYIPESAAHLLGEYMADLETAD
jgi:hypothetical protein